MKISFKKSIYFCLILTVFFLIVFLKTSTSNAENVDSYFATTTNIECSDYYHFGSVKVDVKPLLNQSVAGAGMAFTGSILNTNSYPIVNGKLYVKIFRDRSIQDNNGPDVLDAFMVKDGISLDAGASLPIDFQWKIPAYALGGNYKVATYFVTSDKFNLAGLSFTDDVVGGLSSFTVKGQQNKGVFFKKDGVRINDRTYGFASYPPVVDATSPVSIKVPVSNTTDKRHAVVIETNVYKWDAQDSANKIDTQKRVLVIEPGKVLNLPIDVRDNGSSVYYTEVVLKYMDSKSILGIRFVRDSVVMPRINFPSIASYPLLAGKENKIFSCFHNASNSNLPIDGKLKMEVLSNDDEIILSYEYNGNIIGEMSGVAQNFTPKSTFKNFKIHASLFIGDNLVDEVYVPYDCNLISPGKCSSFDFISITSNKLIMITLGILGLLILLSAISFVVYKRFYPKKLLSKIMKNKLKILIIALSLASSMLLTSGVYAQTYDSGTGYDSGSGSDSGSDSGYDDVYTGGDDGCFQVTDWNPKEDIICIDQEDCNPWPKDTVFVNFQGSRLNEVANVKVTSYQPVWGEGPRDGGVSFAHRTPFQSPSLITLEMQRLMSDEARPFITLEGLDVNKKCIATYRFKFKCLPPNVQTISPGSGPTTGGTIVTLTGENLKFVKSLTLGNITIPKSSFLERTNNRIMFETPRSSAGWKDMWVNTICWEGQSQLIRNAFLFIGIDEDTSDVPPPPPPIYFWTPYNYGASIFNPSGSSTALYYWATTSITSNLDGGRWAKALDNFSSQINYDSSVRYEDGKLVKEGDTMPLLTKLYFNFDRTSSTSTNISWNGTGYTEDTPLGSWIDNAAYPSGQVCSPGLSGKNFVTTVPFVDVADGNKTKNIDVFIPLSVKPPDKKIAFSDNLVTNPPNTVANDILSPDEDNWECEYPGRSFCKPLNSGNKKINMFYSPTYGYFYYGWRWSANPNVCYTNNIALHEITTMTVNPWPYPTTDTGVDTCIVGNGNCDVTFGGLRLTAGDRNIVRCSASYPYYNPQTNKCYATKADYLASRKTDSNIPVTNAPGEYTNPYRLDFRESLYSLNVNISGAPTNRKPSSPVITGPDSVRINQQATYSAVSNVITAKGESKSMLGSVIFAVKKVFAQAQTSKVYYLFDWDNDGTGDSTGDFNSPEVEYGVSVSSSNAWSALGTSTFAVRAVDTVSHTPSEWVRKDILILPAEDAVTLERPEPTATYCQSNLNISWTQVLNADGYIVYKNGASTGSDVGSALTWSDTGFSSASDSYTIQAYKVGPPDAVSEQSVILSLGSSNITQNCPPITTISSGVTEGIKFYANPNWAGTDNKCKFNGYVKSIVKDGDGNTYNDVTVNSCYVDNSATGVSVSPVDSFIIKGVIGKHTLYCDLNYVGGTKSDGTAIEPGGLSASLPARCSKAPTVIER
jgi:hypothetical protein